MPGQLPATLQNITAQQYRGCETDKIIPPLQPLVNTEIDEIDKVFACSHLSQLYHKIATFVESQPA